MPLYPELEIALDKLDGETYRVTLRYSDPASEAEKAPAQGVAALDFAGLAALQLNPAAYGQILSAGLLQDAKLKDFYRECRAAVESAGQALRLRLFIGQSAPELHPLRWELLADPLDNAPLLGSQKILFSRYAASADWRPVKLRPKAELRVVVAVANAINLAEYGLAGIDRDGEISRAREALQGVTITLLDKPVTLDSLAQSLEGADILYLACHGALIKNEAVLYLQDEAGKVKPVKGAELAQRLRELVQLPRLAVLASCESAGSGGQNTSAEAALAPRLNDAGIAAVVAMQGKISMDTVSVFMPRFFQELLKDGQLDRALAAARGAARERADYWMPVLYSRLKGGKLWYEPGFGSAQEDFEKWQAIVNSMRAGECTPILGPGVGEAIYGAFPDLARQLAEQHGFPLSPAQAQELPAVMQYLSKSQDPKLARTALQNQLHDAIVKRHPALSAAARAEPLPKLLQSVGAAHLADADDPYKILAELPCPYYLTANPDNLLDMALKAAGKQPSVILCPWKRNEPPPEAYDDEPSTQKPLVYHMLGRFKDADSLVLTEDDFFQFLIGATRNRDLIPPLARERIASSALLFLGFQPNDWNFRVLFQLIMSQEGGSRLDDYAHVAVQVSPDEDTMRNPAQARKYLEGYFKDRHFSIYWGTAADFLRQLRQQLAAAATTPVKSSDEEGWD
jgi:hypothetical protein